MTLNKGNFTPGRNEKMFQGLLKSGSVLMLFLGDPKNHCDLPIKEGAYEGQMISVIYG